MRCEVCGNRIRGEPKKVLIEGAKMLVCEECAKLGSAYVEPKVTYPKASQISIKKTKTPLTFLSPVKKETDSLQEELELKENFGALIREAREKMVLNHEDLGRKIGEKVSVLKKIESEKMFPDKRLATKLEHTLKIKLLVQAEAHEVPGTALSAPASQLTLGEIAQLKTGKRRNSKNEGSDSSEKTPF